MARDCTVRRDPNVNYDSSPPPPNGAPGPKGFDSEYASLMAELGEGAGGGGGDPGKAPWGANGPGPQVANSDLPPWRRPEVWQSAGLGGGGTQGGAQGGYRPPQQGYSGAYGGAGYSAPQGYGQGQGPWAGYQASSYPQQQQDAYAQYYQQQQYGQQAPQ